MNLLKETYSLIKKDFTLEFRLKFAISGILLYVLSTVFIVYSSFVRIEPLTWNAVLWIVILFAAVNAVGKSFVLENSDRQLYYYSIAHPIAIILSKMLYNISLLFVLSLLCWLGFSFVAGNPIQDTGVFFLALFLGSLGFSIAFTFTAAIASKAQNNATLMAILSFPVIIPILMTLIKLSAGTLGEFDNEGVSQDITILLAIDALLIGMSLILFPFLWRD